MQIDEETMMRDYIRLAIREDVGDGDHTTLSCIPASARGKAVLVAKEAGVIAGMDVARMVYGEVDPQVKFTPFVKDGDEVNVGDKVFEVEGASRSILTAERLSLNYIQRMSGIATHTRSLVELIGKESKTVLLDTRKTTPNNRVFEKAAVKVGGGRNHRFGLFDMILIKDNHVDFAGGIPQAVKAAKDYCKANGKNLKIELEVRNSDEIDQALEAGVDRIMLDNFTPERTREAVKQINGRCEIESSGGITLETLRQYGECGVDFISVGALTHSVKGLDMSFKAC